MTVGELIDELQQYPKDMRIIMFPEGGWSDISDVKGVFHDWVALFDEESFSRGKKIGGLIRNETSPSN